jgi:hypothetical protein
VAADAEIDRDVFLADFGGTGIGRGDAFAARLVAHGGHDLVERPFEVDRCRPRRDQAPVGALQRFVGGVVLQGDAHAVGRDRADQRRAPGLHRGDRIGGIGKRRQPQRHHLMRQPRLVDDADGLAVGFAPDTAPVCSIDQHVRSFSRERETAPFWDAM